MPMFAHKQLHKKNKKPDCYITARLSTIIEESQDNVVLLGDGKSSPPLGRACVLRSSIASRPSHDPTPVRASH